MLYMDEIHYKYTNFLIEGRVPIFFNDEEENSLYFLICYAKSSCISNVVILLFRN